VTPPQGQGQPWWRYDNPDQPTGGSYQAPPVYPGSYQAPPGPGSYQAPPGPGSYQAPPGPGSYQGPPGPGSYQVPPGPTLPAPTPTGPPGSRKPLIYGLVAGLVAAAVAAGVLVLTHKPTPTTPPNPGSSTTAPPSLQPTSNPATPTTQSPTVSAQEQAADNLSMLLTQSVTDRSSIVAAVADAQGCGSNLNQDPQILQNAATSRQNLLSQLANLSGASNLPQNLVTNLRGAWQSSMEADSAYAKYAQDQIANGCVKNDTADPNYQAAIGPDGQATNYKQAFVALWNPIAMQYGLPTYQWSEL
jgi:hypothetical protein